MSCSEIGDHPQRKFGYKSGMKEEKFKNPVHILATCWNLL
jgi:hypothetical protein